MTDQKLHEIEGAILLGAQVPTKDIEALIARVWQLQDQQNVVRSILLKAGAEEWPDLVDVAKDAAARQGRLDDAFDEIKEALKCDRDETAMLIAIRDLQLLSNPDLDWKPVEGGFWCVIGCIVFNVQNGGKSTYWRWSISIQPEEELIEICENPPLKFCDSPEAAKAACKAAYRKIFMNQ